MRKPPAKKTRSEYEVGWGRPPKSKRWKRGQSGNPNGRPRSRKNRTAILREALDHKIQIEERGITRAITVYEAIIKRFTTLALKGDLRAIKLMLDIAPEPSEAMKQPERSTSMSAEEAQRTYLAMIRQVRG